MNDNAADKIAMLLSTDWFFPYWELIGLGPAEETRQCIQRGCREIVANMIKDAKEYWLISFAEERMAATRAAVLALADRCGLKNRSAERFRELCLDRPDRAQREKVAWLFSCVSDELATDTELSPGVKPALQYAVAMSDFDGEDLERLSSESQTTWDIRIRRLSGDLPTYLTDWISVGVRNESVLDQVLSNLSNEEQQILLDRFKAAAKRAGLRAELPDSW